MGLKEYLHLASVVVVLALAGFVAYELIQFGEDRVRVKDLKDLRREISNNALIAKGWHDEQVTAVQKSSTSMDALRSTVLKQPPVIVHFNTPARTGSVPAGSSITSSCTPADTGGVPSGSGKSLPEINWRPLLNDFELKYGQKWADCRVLWDSWPR